MELSFTLFQLVMTFLLMVFLASSTMSIWYFVRPVGKKETNWLLASLLGALSLSLLHNLLESTGIFKAQPRYYFLPIWYTLAFGPLLFFFVKSRLFRPFYLKKSDLKHFILPLLQTTFYIMVVFREPAFKSQLWEQQYIPVFKPVEGLFYIIGFSFYLYFSYRFIRYKMLLLKRRKNSFAWERDKANRLKRMLKGLVFLFGISAAAIVADFFTYQLLGINLYNIRGFTYIGDLSFAFLVLWVTYYAFRNAFFPSRQRFPKTRDVVLLKKEISRLLEEEKIFLDDELDRWKLAYYLRFPVHRLKQLLHEDFRKIIITNRIHYAKERLQTTENAENIIASVAMETGFRDKATFLRVFQQMEHTSPTAFWRKNTKKL